jgi:hypothetical protein
MSHVSHGSKAEQLNLSISVPGYPQERTSDEAKLLPDARHAPGRYAVGGRQRVLLHPVGDAVELTRDGRGERKGAGHEEAEKAEPKCRAYDEPRQPEHWSVPDNVWVTASLVDRAMINRPLPGRTEILNIASTPGE